MPTIGESPQSGRVPSSYTIRITIAVPDDAKIVVGLADAEEGHESDIPTLPPCRFCGQSSPTPELVTSEECGDGQVRDFYAVSCSCGARGPLAHDHDDEPPGTAAARLWSGRERFEDHRP